MMMMMMTMMMMKVLVVHVVVNTAGAGHSSEVERSLMVRWVVGPIELFLLPASAP